MDTKLCPKCKRVLDVLLFLDSHRRILARCQTCQEEHRADFQIRKQLKKQGQNKCKECKEIKLLAEFKFERAICKSCDCDKTRLRYKGMSTEEKQNRKAIRDAKRIADPANSMLKEARKRAKRDALPFEINKADIITPKYCPILGIPLQIGIGTRSDNSPSLDKIIPNRGYVKGNIQVISYRANRFKSDASLEELNKLVNYLNKLNAKSS